MFTIERFRLGKKILIKKFKKGGNPNNQKNQENFADKYSELMTLTPPDIKASTSNSPDYLLLQNGTKYLDQPGNLRWGIYYNAFGARPLPTNEAEARQFKKQYKNWLKYNGWNLSNVDERELWYDLTQQYNNWYENESKDPFVWVPIHLRNSNNVNYRINQAVDAWGNANDFYGRSSNNNSTDSTNNSTSQTSKRNQMFEKNGQMYMPFWYSISLNGPDKYKKENLSKVLKENQKIAEQWSKQHPDMKMPFVNGSYDVPGNYVYALQYFLGKDQKDWTPYLTFDLLKELANSGFWENDVSLERFSQTFTGNTYGYSSDGSTFMSPKSDQKNPSNQPKLPKSSKQTSKQKSSKTTTTNSYPVLPRRTIETLNRKAKANGFNSWTEVYDLQKQLGFTGKDLDGDYGPKTKAAHNRQSSKKKDSNKNSVTFNATKQKTAESATTPIKLTPPKSKDIQTGTIKIGNVNGKSSKKDDSTKDLIVKRVDSKGMGIRKSRYEFKGPHMYYYIQLWPKDEYVDLYIGKAKKGQVKSFGDHVLKYDGKNWIYIAHKIDPNKESKKKKNG